MRKEVLCLALAATVCQATELSPLWSIEDPNSSYLCDTKYLGEPGLQLLPMKKQLELKQQYEDMNRDYNIKRDYGLMDSFYEATYISAMSGFGNDIFRQIEREQLVEMRAIAAHNLKNDPDAKQAIVPVEVVGGAYMISTGKPVTLNVADGNKVVTTTNVRNQQASVGFVSSTLDTTASISHTPTIYQYGSIVPADPAAHDERYRFSISKPIATLALTPSAYYGSTSTELMLGLVKQVTQHISIGYSHNVPLNPAISDYKTTEDVVRVNYGINL